MSAPCPATIATYGNTAEAKLELRIVNPLFISATALSGDLYSVQLRTPAKRGWGCCVANGLFYSRFSSPEVKTITVHFASHSTASHLESGDSSQPAEAINFTPDLELEGSARLVRGRLTAYCNIDPLRRLANPHTPSGSSAGKSYKVERLVAYRLLNVYIRGCLAHAASIAPSCSLLSSHC